MLFSDELHQVSINVTSVPDSDGGSGPEVEERRRRRMRTNFTNWQMRQLELAFVSGHYPDVFVRESLADRLQLPESRIQVLRLCISSRSTL